MPVEIRRTVARLPFAICVYSTSSFGRPSCQRRDDHGWIERRVEDRGQRADEAFRDDARAQLEREHRVELLQLRLLALRAGDDAERAELLLEEHLRVVRGDLLSELLGDALGDLVVPRCPSSSSATK
jgi:hypothetical protein